MVSRESTSRCARSLERELGQGHVLGAGGAEPALEEDEAIDAAGAKVDGGEGRPPRAIAPPAQGQVRMERARLRRETGGHCRALAGRLQSVDSGPRLHAQPEDTRAP